LVVAALIGGLSSLSNGGRPPVANEAQDESQSAARGLASPNEAPTLSRERQEATAPLWDVDGTRDAFARTDALAAILFESSAADSSDDWAADVERFRQRLAELANESP
jgi:hypothetical protein